jgi:hypothetical protein
MPAHRVLAILVLSALVSSLAADDFTPGAHKRLPCDGNKEWTWDVYVPKAYAEKKDKKFPVMWCCSAGGNPGFWGLEQWAEKNEALLVAMNDPKNGLDWPTIHKMQDDVIATSEAKLRLHPCLRFSTGASGGAWQAMFIANRHPDQHAGVIMQIHSGNGTICPKHISVAFIAGDADKTHPISATKAAYQGFKRRGNPAKILVVAGRGHESATTEEIIGMLDWMYNYQRVTNPKLPPEDKAAVKKEIAERSKACGDIKDPAARLTESEILMGMPDVERSPDYKTLVLAWFKASRELAEAKTDAAEKHEELFQLVDDPHSRLVPSAETQAVNKLLTDLRKDPAIRAEWEALQIYARVQKAETAAGEKRSELKMAAEGYRAIAQKYPNTRAGKDAAEDAKRLTPEKK